MLGCRFQRLQLGRSWGGRDALVPAVRPEVIDRINPRSRVNCAPLHVLRITDREFGVERMLKCRLRNCWSLARLYASVPDLWKFILSSCALSTTFLVGWVANSIWKRAELYICFISENQFGSFLSGTLDKYSFQS